MNVMMQIPRECFEVTNLFSMFLIFTLVHVSIHSSGPFFNVFPPVNLNVFPLVCLIHYSWFEFILLIDEWPTITENNTCFRPVTKEIGKTNLKIRPKFLDFFKAVLYQLPISNVLFHLFRKRQTLKRLREASPYYRLPLIFCF